MKNEIKTTKSNFERIKGKGEDMSKTLIRLYEAQENIKIIFKKEKKRYEKETTLKTIS